MSFVLEPVLAGSRASGHEFLVLEPPGRTLRKYVIVQDEPDHLPKLVDLVLSVLGPSTVGLHVQTINQGRRTKLQTALALLRVYGPGYFTYKLWRLTLNRVRERVVNRLLRRPSRPYGVAAAAQKHGVPVHYGDDINSEEFRAVLRDLGVELIVSISGTQIYRRELRMQVPFGIINCHGALLPRYRGLMPSFWTLANGEECGGVSVHYVDRKLDNGPIVVQRRYALKPEDTLEDVVTRSKAIAAEAILEAVRLIEAGDPPLLPNEEAQGSRYGMPTAEDARRLREHGHAFR